MKHADPFPIILAIAFLIMYQMALYLRNRHLRRVLFDDQCDQVQKYMDWADRTNIHHAMKASDMMGTIEAQCGRNERFWRKYKQLLIFWKSKFIHLFPKNHKP